MNPEGKYVVDIDKTIDVLDIKPNLRVALRNDSYVLHKVRYELAKTEASLLMYCRCVFLATISQLPALCS